MITQKEITLPPFQRGCHLITHHIEKAFEELPVTGMINIFLKHTSAGLCINENADPTVRQDFNSFFNKLVPENLSIYKHIYEGPDDITAHLKTAIVGHTLNIPITNHKMALGTWQGIYLCEFRNSGGNRRLILTVFG